MKKVLPFALLLILSAVLSFAVGRAAEPPDAADAPQPALSVRVIRPELQDLPSILTAGGSVAAWQEAVIGAEVGGLRLSEIRAQIGDRVRKGQVLALLDRELVAADVARSRALLAEAEAMLAEARVNAERARRALRSAAMSAQQADQYLTGEKTAEARVQSARAQLDIQLLRLDRTQVRASDDGVISARSAVLGAVPAEGQELFRLIRRNRLEWRGEVGADELLRIAPGMAVTVEVPGAAGVAGTVRTVGPTLDDRSRSALVYVDLPGAERAGLRPGMYGRGEFRLGSRPGLTVPLEALSLRDGFSYMFRIGEVRGDQARVAEVKVRTGRRAGDRIEILSGIERDDPLVAAGAAFLADGDRVRVVPQ